MTQDEYDRLKLSRWLEKCSWDILRDSTKAEFAQGTGYGLLEHIQKHAGPDLLRYALKDAQKWQVNWRQWSASMHNLLAMFDYIFAGGITPREQLGQLQRKYDSNPARYSPPPDMADVKADE